jgi:NAD(P)-dependent dehydrogenase (short-subunit alcohol dehydrogenase family)
VFPLTKKRLYYKLNPDKPNLLEAIVENSIKGKTVLVTGGTNGIGLVTARELARMGAQVTIVSRNPVKCAAVAEAIKAETGVPVDFIAADLSTLVGIMQAAASFKQRHTHLHVLVNNAGAMFARRQLTSDGFEMTFALNHLNYFLLTNLLLDVLKASAPARIVSVSSGAHMRGSIEFDNCRANAILPPCKLTDNPSLPTSYSPMNWPAAWRAAA